MTVGVAPIPHRPVGRWHVHGADDQGMSWIAVCPYLEDAVAIADDAAGHLAVGTNLTVTSTIGTTAYRTTGWSKSDVVPLDQYIPPTGATGPETIFGIGYSDMPKADGDRWSLALFGGRRLRALLWSTRQDRDGWTDPSRPLGYVVGHPDDVQDNEDEDPNADQEHPGGPRRVPGHPSFVAAWNDETARGLPWSGPWTESDPIPQVVP